MIDTAAIPAFSPASAQTQTSGKIVAVFLMSFAALLRGLGLTRIFSVVLFYHFAFLAISIALLGLGAGAVFAHLRAECVALCSDATLWAGRWRHTQCCTYMVRPSV